MKICVLVKQVPDKDSDIKLTGDGFKIDQTNLNFLILSSPSFFFISFLFKEVNPP